MCELVVVISQGFSRLTSFECVCNKTFCESNKQSSNWIVSRDPSNDPQTFIQYACSGLATFLLYEIISWLAQFVSVSTTKFAKIVADFQESSDLHLASREFLNFLVKRWWKREKNFSVLSRFNHQLFFFRLHSRFMNELYVCINVSLRSSGPQKL